MRQQESILQNIHESKLKLNQFRSIVCIDEIQKLHINSAIEFYLQELKDLRECLRYAINQKGL